MEHIEPINYVLDTSDENFVAIDDKYKIPALYEAFDYVARELVDKINTEEPVSSKNFFVRYGATDIL